ncbi:MAG: DUF2249 domain-containing protein [Deltaproteobacteria bacterium]
MSRAGTAAPPARIQIGDRVGAVLARDARLLEVFVAASPAFEKLRSAAMRKTMARLVTIEQAARIAGIEAGELVERLNRALSDPSTDHGAEPTEPTALPTVTAPILPPIPEALTRLPSERLVECDVREDLRAGIEPFKRIFEAARTLPAGSALRVRATFEPAPLYAVLARQGLAHATEQLAAEDWRVWFYRDEAPATAPAPAPAPAPVTDGDGDMIVLDVRGLEPPEPMVRTLEALAEMPRGKTLVQLNVRVPQYLLPKLSERGFVYDIREQGPDLVRLFIRHRPSPSTLKES